MARILQQVVAHLLVLGIVFVFVSPALNLEPTALRAAHAAQLAMIAVAMSAKLVAGLCDLPKVTDINPEFAGVVGDPADLVDLNCSRLC